MDVFQYVGVVHAIEDLFDERVDGVFEPGRLTKSARQAERGA